jgi:four helix bundle protein
VANHNFKELNIWKRSMNVAFEVYKLITFFKPEEKFGLTAQCRRSALSIPSNIAEGSGRTSDKYF